MPMPLAPRPASGTRRTERGVDRKIWARIRQRGATLIEILVAIALVGVLTGGMFLGMGALAGARLKRSASLIAGAVRVAYNHANATSRPVRLAFDFDARTVTMEQGAGRMLLRHGERSGGAYGATEAEQEAQAAADEIAAGPQAPRVDFKPISPHGFGTPNEEDPTGKMLSRSIHFLQIEVEHEDEPVESERAYLYFWPGGQTERCAIQLMLGSDPTQVDEDDIITLLVAPLTGKVEILAGAVEMPRPMTDEEASERDDPGF